MSIYGLWRPGCGAVLFVWLLASSLAAASTARAAPQPLQQGVPSARTVAPSALQTARGATRRRGPTGAHAPALGAVPDPSPASLTGGDVHFAPAQGPPGTLVRVSGFLPGGPTPSHARHVAGDRTGVVCWAGCADGWTQNVEVIWSARRQGAFTARFRVPRVPWLSPRGPRPLAPGAYTVAVDPAGAPFALLATFRLTGPAPARCGPGEPCARLAVAPAAAAPGTVVRVSGWAPLVSPTGSPFAYTLELRPESASPRAGGQAPLALAGEDSGELTQGPSGALDGWFVLPPRTETFGAVKPGAYRLTLAGALAGAPGDLPVAASALRVTAAERWASLGAPRPLAVQRAAVAAPNATVPGDPADRGRCLPRGGIAVSQDGGRHWRPVPTAGAAAVARRAGYVLAGPGMPGSPATSPPCATLALLAARPETVFAAFPGERGSYGDVPFYWLAMETEDGGRTWRLLPPPHGFSINAFSRFVINGDALQAWFWGGPIQPLATDGIEQTDDGGRTWTPGLPHCPAVGPCLVFGPRPTWTWPGVCNGQALLWSADGGRTWRTALWPREVCYVGTGPGGPYDLVAIGPHSSLLLGGFWTYPLRLTVDGGRTWRDIAVPLLPGMKPGGVYEPPYPGLHIQADGSLAAWWSRTWWVLPPGARAWCASGVRVPASGAPPPPYVLRCARGG